MRRLTSCARDVQEVGRSLYTQQRAQRRDGLVFLPYFSLAEKWIRVASISSLVLLLLLLLLLQGGFVEFCYLGRFQYQLISRVGSPNLKGFSLVEGKSTRTKVFVVVAVAEVV